ncbi:MAG: inositol monophosphatase family protein [Planctomycetota bacterium]
MIDNYLEFAIKIARQAGKLLVSLQPRLAKYSKTKSTTCDLVTKADYLSEKLIINGVRKKFPNHRILAEEEYSSKIQHNPTVSYGDMVSDSLLWVIDPLDGTTNYSHQFPFYCVSIALVKNNKTLLGVVYNPNLDELFYARIGHGAYLNHKRLKVSNIKSLDKSLLATGFPYIICESPGDNFRNFQDFCLNAQAIRRAGAAALDLAYLAAGRVDGFWERELKPWDTAAGILIVTEAGGKVTDFNNNEYNPFLNREILATNKYIHQQMINLLNDK